MPGREIVLTKKFGKIGLAALSSEKPAWVTTLIGLLFLIGLPAVPAGTIAIICPSLQTLSVQ